MARFTTRFGSLKQLASDDASTMRLARGIPRPTSRRFAQCFSLHKQTWEELQ